MKDRDTVAYILKFPKFMRCHYHRKLPFFHFLTKQVFHHFRHDRIKTVEHFITEKVFCSGTKGKDKEMPDVSYLLKMYEVGASFPDSISPPYKPPPQHPCEDNNFL